MPLGTSLWLSPGLRLPGVTLTLPSAPRPVPASPLAAAPVGESAVAALEFNNAYGFYSWLSGLDEVQGAARPELAKARLLIDAYGPLSQGPVFAMKEGKRLTLLSSKDPSIPPVTLSLARESLDAEPSARARLLADRLEAAAARASLSLRKRVEEAHVRAHDTLRLIELYGPIDPETGLPTGGPAGTATAG